MCDIIESKQNALNDVVGLMDKDGNVVVTYLYDAWGNITSVTGTMVSTLGVDNPFRYRGYIYDFIISKIDTMIQIFVALVQWLQ